MDIAELTVPLGQAAVYGASSLEAILAQVVLRFYRHAVTSAEPSVLCQ